jgi:hypothetical protein
MKKQKPQNSPDVASRLERIEALLARTLGLSADLNEPDPVFLDPREHPPDYIEHGSDEHRELLGLVEVGDAEEARENGFDILHRSPKSGRLFHLADEMTPFANHPNPDKAARLALIGKVNELDAGTPPVPEDAKEMWWPAEPDPRLTGYYG